MKKNQLSLFDESKFSLSTKEFKEESAKFAGFSLSIPKKSAPKRKSRADGIYLPEEKKPLTYGLRFEDKRQRIPEWALPKISTFREDVLRIINENDEIGLDFEYNPTTRYLSIIGVAAGNECAACRYDKQLGAALLKKIKNPNSRFIGHFVLGADKPVLEESMREETPLWLWEDSMIVHYLCHAELAKAPGKEADGDGALGFNSLGFAGHLWTSVHQWKSCPGMYCEAQLDPNFPCPAHAPQSYCAVDSWVGLEVFNRGLEFMEGKGIPKRVYDEHKELALNFCLAAEKRGMYVDLDYARKLETEMEKKKDELFPKNNPKFNPRSNIQVVRWFEKNGIKLSGNDKATIELTLESHLFDNYGITSIGEVDEETELDDVTRMLYDLYTFKAMGKGTDAWVAEKYITYETN